MLTTLSCYNTKLKSFLSLLTTLLNNSCTICTANFNKWLFYCPNVLRKWTNHRKSHSPLTVQFLFHCYCYILSTPYWWLVQQQVMNLCQKSVSLAKFSLFQRRVSPLQYMIMPQKGETHHWNKQNFATETGFRDRLYTRCIQVLRPPIFFLKTGKR